MRDIISALQLWRDEDQADTIILHRNEVIQILEMIKKLREELGLVSK